MYKHQFVVGRTYLTREGKAVKIIAESMKYGPHYRCVQGDDGEDLTDEFGFTPGSERGWRYDRPGECEVGRCTGSAVDNPRNLVPGTALMGQVDITARLGAYYITRFGDSCRERGVLQTAKNARKQGISIDVTMAMLRLFYGRA